MQKATLEKALRLILYTAIAFIPLFFLGKSMFPFNIPKIILFQSLMEVALALWLGLVLMDRSYVPRKNAILWALLIFFGALGLTTLTGVDILRSLWSNVDRLIGLVALVHFGIFSLILASLGQRLNWKLFWSLSFWSATLVALMVPLTGNILYNFLLKQGSSRPGSTFGNASFMAAYILFNFFIGGWLMQESRNTKYRWAVAVAMLLQAAAVLLSQTIGTILSLGLGIILFLLYKAAKSEGRARTISVALLALIFLCGLTLVFTRHSSAWQKVPGVSRIATISLKQGDVETRLITWHIALQAFKDKPLLGWGWENFEMGFSKHYDPHIYKSGFNATLFDKPHDVLLEYLTTGGILGFAAYIALLSAVGYAIFKAGRGKSWQPFFALAFITYMAQNLLVFDTAGTYLMFFALIGFLAAELAPSGETNSAPLVPRPEIWAIGLLVLAAVPVHALNWKTAYQMNRYFWGVNYFLHSLPETSDLSWQEALSVHTPYDDYVWKDYASVLKQGMEQGIYIPDQSKIVDRQARAIEGLRHAIQRHPQDSFFSLQLAEFYNTFYSMGTDYLKRAEDMENLALALSPNRQQIYFAQARTKILESKNDKALSIMKHIVELNPDSGDAHFFYGMLTYAIGDKNVAHSEVQRAAELGREPLNAQEAINLGSFMGDKNGDYVSAIRYLKMALGFAEAAQNVKATRDAELKLAIAYYLHNQMADAKAAFERLSKEIDMTQLPIWPNLQIVFRELGIPLPK